jgi:hypothetical protein
MQGRRALQWLEQEYFWQEKNKVAGGRERLLHATAQIKTHPSSENTPHGSPATTTDGRATAMRRAPEKLSFGGICPGLIATGCPHVKEDGSYRSVNCSFVL